MNLIAGLLIGIAVWFFAIFSSATSGL